MVPPLPLKNSSSSSQTQTLASPHLRDAMRAATVPYHPPSYDPIPAAAEVRFGPRIEQFAAAEAKNSRILCYEEIDGRKWSYVVEEEEEASSRRKRTKKGGGSSLRAVSMQAPMAPAEELMSFIRSYVVPEGFPDSVTPSYVPYMTWRALKHFFGGALGVFTTKALLNSVGVSRHGATNGAVAINWILKTASSRELIEFLQFIQIKSLRG